MFLPVLFLKNKEKRGFTVSTTLWRATRKRNKFVALTNRYFFIMWLIPIKHVSAMLRLCSFFVDILCIHISWAFSSDLESRVWTSSQIDINSSISLRQNSVVFFWLSNFSMFHYKQKKRHLIPTIVQANVLLTPNIAFPILSVCSANASPFLIWM